MPCRPIGLADFKDPTLLDSQVTYGGEVVSLVRRPHSVPQIFFFYSSLWYSFQLEAE
jgi:hypothetical protein